MPIRWIAKKIADSGERTLIERMYAEFQATGRVDQFLPDDDRTIRDLVAARDQKRTESKTIVRETILAETRAEESSSAESSTKSKEHKSQEYQQPVQQKYAATGHPASGGKTEDQDPRKRRKSPTKRETRTTSVAAMNSLSSMLNSGNQLATPASYSNDTRITLQTTSPTASTSRTFPPPSSFSSLGRFSLNRSRIPHLISSPSDFDRPEFDSCERFRSETENRNPGASLARFRDPHRNDSRSPRQISGVDLQRSPETAIAKPRNRECTDRLSKTNRRHPNRQHANRRKTGSLIRAIPLPRRNVSTPRTAGESHSMRAERQQKLRIANSPTRNATGRPRRFVPRSCRNVTGADGSRE